MSAADSRTDDPEDDKKPHKSGSATSKRQSGNSTPWWKGAPVRGSYPSLDEAPEIPVATASLFSVLTFQWVQDVMLVGWSRHLQAEDLWSMDASRKSAILATKLQGAWEKRRKAADDWNASIVSGEARPGIARQLWWRIRALGNSSRVELLERSWRERAVYTPNLIWALMDTFGFQIWLGGAFKLFGDVAQLGGPLISRTIIEYAQQRAAAKAEHRPAPPLRHGIGAAVGLFLLTVFASLCQHQWFWRSMSLGISVRSALINSLHTRGLALSPKSRTTHSNAALVNHLSTDTSRIDYLCQWSHPAWTAPVQVVICVIILCTEMGPSALAGFAVFLLLVPVQFKLMHTQLKLRRESMVHTDKRANLLQEVLGAMRITKLFTYETSFWTRISSLRHDELQGIRTLLTLRSAHQSVAFCTPVIASVLAFVVYALAGHDLNPAVIFTSLSLFNLLRAPLMLMPRALSAIPDGRNALARISKVFLAETLDSELVPDPDLPEALVIANASFEWETPSPPDQSVPKKSHKRKAPKETTQQKTSNREPFCLKDLNLTIPRGGTITAIAGPIGSGKSSFILGLIGEMRRTNGTVTIGGSLAYCAQLPWIQNSSLRDNITFGRPFNSSRYYAAISQACLEPDLALLPDGDMTEIGEKGINLSGGQKARVNLARALYSDADVVALDDPLSAVDAHVAEKLFSGAILNMKASGKTVILVTHALHFLPQVDHICYLGEGSIQEEGTFDELIAAGGSFSDLVRDFGHGHNDKRDEGEPKNGMSTTPQAEDIIAAAEQSEDPKDQGHPAHLMQKETRRTGQVKGDVYKSYLSSSGGIPLLTLLLAVTGLMEASQVITSYWLIWWQDRTFGGPQGFYMGTYAGLGFAQAGVTFAFGAVMSWMSYLASNNLHGKGLRRVLHAPMSFFDTTPLGRILSVFGKDMDTIDNTLADSLRNAMMTINTLMASVILLTIVIQYFLPIVVLVLVGYVALAKFYTASSRELKRLDGILRSFLYAHFAESLSGIATIRAYGATSRFIAENGRYVDHENAALYVFTATQRWMSVRLDFLGALLTFAVAMMAVYGLNGVSPAQIGLVLTNIVSITQILGMMVRQTAEVENNMNAVERVYQYSNESTIPQEAAYEDSDSTDTPPNGWPVNGEVDFSDVVMSYRPGLVPVLRGVSLHINGGEKIGIVGRTGAGKSSMMAILFRLIELSSGSIHIDGVEISKLALRQLRSRISIIPQEALLFSGTVRSNLDPFSEHEDKDLWDALRRAHVSVESHDDKQPSSGSRFTLDTSIDAEGANLSVGERSLLSLARALCKDTQIVVMDEATASVDLETDSKIQETILREFKHKTLLCIAHRLRTIINYQRVLVMDQGKVAEFDTPLNLFDKPDGIFRSMCETSHITRDDIETAWRASAWGSAE